MGKLETIVHLAPTPETKAAELKTKLILLRPSLQTFDHNRRFAVITQCRSVVVVVSLLLLVPAIVVAAIPNLTKTQTAIIIAAVVVALQSYIANVLKSLDAYHAHVVPTAVVVQEAYHRCTSAVDAPLENIGQEDALSVVVAYVRIVIRYSRFGICKCVRKALTLQSPAPFVLTLEQRQAFNLLNITL
jgi:hypothetical protein